MRESCIRDKIVVLEEPKGNKTGRELKGIRTIYQLRVRRNLVGRQIMYRADSCWCIECSSGNFDACLTESRWQIADLENRAANRQQLNDVESSDSEVEA